MPKSKQRKKHHNLKAKYYGRKCPKAGKLYNSRRTWDLVFSYLAGDSGLFRCRQTGELKAFKYIVAKTRQEDLANPRYFPRVR